MAQQNFRHTSKFSAVQMTGIDELQEGMLNKMKMQQQVRIAMESIGAGVTEAFRTATPERTGKTASAWKNTEISGNVTVFNDRLDSKGQLVAMYLIEGSQAAFITPVNKLALTNRNYPDLDYYSDFGRDGRPRKWAFKPEIQPNSQLRFLFRDGGAATIAGEIAVEQITGFFENRGTLQPRTKGGKFGFAWVKKVKRGR